MSAIMTQSARPTAEFRRHHAVEAPQVDARARRPYWTILGRFDRLYRRREISHAAFEAGRRWRQDCDRATGRSAPSLTGLLAGVTPGARTPGDEQLDAQARLREVTRKLGTSAVALLACVIIEDQSWRSLARKHRLTPSTIKTAFSETLEQLAELYDGYPE